VVAPDLGQILLARGLLSQEQLEEALKTQKTITGTGVKIDLEEVLVRKGFLSSQQVASLNAALGKGRTDLIPGFEIVSKIGQGGMGAVYKARQLSMDRLVALKVLLPSFAQEKNAVERFLREAKVIAKLSHPNLISGIDAGYHNGIYYCVMEYVEGQTLGRLLEGSQGLPWKDVFSIARQVASALGHAEQHRIVHRDVKPDNIMIDRSGAAKLMDLGIAKLAAGGKTPATLTNTGLLMGTPAYMSPEQAQSVDLDIRSDLYSLGLTMFEALCGRRAYDAPTPFALLTKRLQEKPRYDWLVCPDPVVAVVRKLTVRDRDSRYRSPAELIEDLDAVLAGGAPVHASIVPRAAPAAAPPRLRRKKMIMIAASAGLLTAGTALLLLPPDKKEARTAAVPRTPTPGPEPAKPADTPKLPTPTPAPPPDPSEELWKSALEYESGSAARPEEVLLNFLQVKGNLRGTSRIGDVDLKIAEWKRRVEEAVRTERERLEASTTSIELAKSLEDLQAASRRFADPTLRSEPDMPEYATWPASIKALELRTRERLHDLLQTIREAAAQHRAKKDFDAAIREFDRMKSLGIEECFNEAIAELARLANERRAHEEDLARRKEADAALLRQAWQDATKSARSRDYDSALKTLQEARATIAHPDVIPQADQRLADMDLAASVPREFDDPSKKPTDRIVAAYRAAKKSSSLPLFLFALFESDLATAEKEAPKPLPPEYEELLQELRVRAEEIKTRTKKAGDLLKEANRLHPSQRTREDALAIYRTLVEQYKDVLSTRDLAAINARIVAWVEHVVDAPQLQLGGQCELRADGRSGLGQVVVIQGDPDGRSVASFQFEARAGTVYKLWLHMSFFEIDQNAVRVAFDGDVALSDQIGDHTDRSYVVQYWPRSQSKGFGWTDRDMRARDGAERVIDLNRSPGPTFKFETSGPKRIRILNLEPGTMIDRVLVSGDKFVRTLPGAAEAQPKR
jgi:serine/threonine-protein kinase